jgi:hypothetical protein
MVAGREPQDSYDVVWALRYRMCAVPRAQRMNQRYFAAIGGAALRRSICRAAIHA